MGLSGPFPLRAQSVGPASASRVLSPRALPYLSGAADLAAIGAAGVLSLALAGDLVFLPACCALVACVYVAAAASLGLYRVTAAMSPGRQVGGVLTAMAGAALSVLAVALGFDRLDLDLAARLGGFSATAVLAIVAARYALRAGLAALGERRSLGADLVVLGAGDQAARLLARFNEQKSPLWAVAGVFDPDRPERRGSIAGHAILGGIDDLMAHARTNRVEDVVVALPWQTDGRAAEVIGRLRELPVNIHLACDQAVLDHLPAWDGDVVGDLPVITVARRPMSVAQSALKAAEDYTLATLALVLISPLFLVIAAAIKLDSPGPVFFRQTRVGFNNAPFSIYKFRSMYHRRAPEVEVKQARRGDPRVTRVGRFIRATSLDELPQLLNVLEGTMSLVGPRPHAFSHHVQYSALIPGYDARHKVKPGITGWAQVNGLRGETEALQLMEARVRHDIEYAENWSLFFDIRILVLTVLTVLFQKTAY